MGLFIFLSNRISTESPTVRFSLGKHRLPIKPLHWDPFDPFPTFNFDNLATFFNLSFCQLAGIRNRIGIQNLYDNGRFIIKAFQNDLIRRVLLHQNYFVRFCNVNKKWMNNKRMDIHLHYFIFVSAFITHKSNCYFHCHYTNIIFI